MLQGLASSALALLLTLALAMGWAESGLVLAHSTAEAGGATSGATTLAEPRLDTTAASSYGWLFALHEQREIAPSHVSPRCDIAEEHRHNTKSAAKRGASINVRQTLVARASGSYRRLTSAKKNPVDHPHIRMPVSASTPPSRRHSLGSTRSP